MTIELPISTVNLQSVLRLTNAKVIAENQEPQRIMITHDHINSTLSDISSVVGPSELHGHLCGRVVIGHDISGAFGKKVLLECLGMSPSDIEHAEIQLQEFREETAGILGSDLFSFRLLLPDDDEPLPVRLHALSEWCQGFLTGIASTAGLNESPVLESEKETINHLAEISQIDTDVDEEDEESEALYSEVSEYVRLAAFNLFDQFRSEDGEPVSTGLESTLH